MGRNRRVPDDPYVKVLKSAGFELNDCDRAGELTAQPDQEHAEALLTKFARFDAGKGAKAPIALHFYSYEDDCAIEAVFLASEGTVLTDSLHPRAGAVLLEMADVLHASAARLVLDPTSNKFGSSARNAMYLNYTMRAAKTSESVEGCVYMEHSFALIDDDEDDWEEFGSEAANTTDAPSDSEDEEEEELGFTPPLTYKA